MTVIPAYGRDYTTAAQAEAAFLSGCDFRAASPVTHGIYCSCRDYAGQSVVVRFGRLRSFVIVNVPEAITASALRSIDWR